jgi:hypothetical protein
MLVALAVGVGVMSLVLNVVGVLFAYRNTTLLGGAVDWVGSAFLLWPLALVVVGTIVASARPRILVGWGLLTAGLSIQVVGVGGAYGGWARLSGSPAPLSQLAIWAGLLASGVFAAAAPLVVTRLPTGRPDTPAARVVSRLSWLLGSVLVAWWGFGGEKLSVNTVSGGAEGVDPLTSPVALIHLDQGVISSITTTLTLSVVACFVASIVLVLRRRRRASSVERAQLRWLAAGLLVLPIVVVVQLLAHELAELAWANLLDTLGLVIGLGAIPVSIAISVLKFRLFEIDRLISRTVVFAVVALILGALYVALAILPFTLLAGIGGDGAPSWVVATSTLAAAALFSPLRRRVQRFVDRRFNRSRYDAERVIDRFSSQVRGFTDVDAIAAGLRGAVQGALQPSGVTVWVREGA